MTTQDLLSHPEVHRLARLLLAARQDRGVNLKGWYETSDATRTALLMDARYVLVTSGVIADDTQEAAARAA